MRRLVSTGLVTLVLVAAGCGGSTSTSDDALPPSFQQRATAVCKDAVARKKAEGPWPYPEFNPTDPDWASYPGVARALVNAPIRFRRWLRDLEALSEPSSNQQAWDALVADVRAHVRIATEQHAAAVRKDSETFTKDYNEGRAVQDDLLEDSKAAGLEVCAQADR